MACSNLSHGKTNHTLRTSLFLLILHPRRCLTQSQLDAGQRDKAAQTVATAAALARKKLPEKLVDVLRLQAHFNLGGETKTSENSKGSMETSVSVKLSKIKGSVVCAKHKHILFFLNTCRIHLAETCSYASVLCSHLLLPLQWS